MFYIAVKWYRRTLDMFTSFLKHVSLKGGARTACGNTRPSDLAQSVEGVASPLLISVISIADVDPVLRGDHVEPERAIVHLHHFRLLRFLSLTLQKITIRIRRRYRYPVVPTLTSWKSDDAGLTAGAGVLRSSLY